MAKIMEQTLEVRNLRELVSHPLNENLYGAVDVDELLVESLEKDGIWPGQIQVTTGNVIISGHRRRILAPLAEIEEAVVWVRDDLPNDPEHPDVLDALIKSNRQREKTNEQRLREYALAKEVRAKQAKLRKQNAPNQKGSRVGQNIPLEEDSGRAREQAAQDVGFEVSPRHVDDALRALKAAEAAEATRDPEKIDAAQKVRQSLNSKITKGIKVARAVGLVPPIEPRKKKEPASQQKPTANLVIPDEQLTQVLQPAEATADVDRPSNQSSAVPKKISDRELKWIKTRWLPALQALAEAHKLLSQEKTRLQNAYCSPSTGSIIFTTIYQRAAALWADQNDLSELSAIIGADQAGIDDLLLWMQGMGDRLSSTADAMRMFTGCRPDNNRHDRLPNKAS